MDEPKNNSGTTADSTKANGGSPTPPVTNPVAEATAAASAGSNESSTAHGAPAAIAELERQLAEAKAETAKNLDGWQRAAAEFANYRKRSDKERGETYQLAAVDTFKKILPVIDDFDRAIQGIPTAQTNGLAYDSLVILHRKLVSLIESAGVKIINPLGEPFNPAYHEALGEDSGTDKASGQVTVVLQKGYVYGEKVLRAAMVRVAS
jgi:molecular chaperone GrpE